jgi:protein-L-isoaspartate(D-aspartate) O-methyltransferase
VADKRNASVTIVQDRPVAAHDTARRAMIDSQLRPSGVNDELVLRRMSEVAREDFLPPSARGFAYMDRAIALGDGRFVPAPTVHGLMLQEARPAQVDQAILVDSGSGYMAELLRPLVGSLEVLSPADAASAASDGSASLLIVDGAVEQIPAALAARLADGARVVTGWLRNNVTCLATGRKAGGEVGLMALAEMGIPVLPAFAAPKGWSF